MNSSRPNKNQQHKKNSNELSELEQEKAKVFEEEDEKKNNFRASKRMNERTRVSNLIAFVWVQHSSWVISSFDATVYRSYMPHRYIHTHTPPPTSFSPHPLSLPRWARNTFYNFVFALFYCGFLFFSLKSLGVPICLFRIVILSSLFLFVTFVFDFYSFSFSMLTPLLFRFTQTKTEMR